jgi:hypothetical protein
LPQWERLLIGSFFLPNIYCAILAYRRVSMALTTVFTPSDSCFDNSHTSYFSGVFVKDFSINALECYPGRFPLFRGLFEPLFSPGCAPDVDVSEANSRTVEVPIAELEGD